ncbi:MAG: phosphatidylserine decarboxylase [Hyphomicrobiaceae bacterium]
MTFAREGWPMAGGVAALSVALGLAFGWAATGIGLVAAFAVLLFFRDPNRNGTDDPRIVLAPADGRVVAVKRDAKPHRFDDKATTQISIFMSPLDVHINRMPLAATVVRVEHRKGSFRAAYAEEASEVNESNSLLLESESGLRLVVVQIAGWLARRIICHTSDGARLGRAERFGLIMFGSRVDVFLPPNVEPLVAVGDRTRTAETPLARLEDCDV